MAAETRAFLEVRRRLQSALLVAGEPKGGDLPLEVCVRQSSLQVRSPVGCTNIQLPAEVRLAPSTCGGLQYVPGDGLHVRLQACAEPCSQLISVFNQSPQAQEHYTFYCQSCGDVVIRDRRLLRVLPLPGANWAALVEEWCCHPDPFSHKSLLPGHGDCFIGDTFYLVNLRSQPWQDPKANSKVICKRCRVTLGETMSPETTKFYMTEIIIQPSERPFPVIPRSQFVQSVVAQRLGELASARSTFRFIIQDQDGKVYILLWLLNSDSLVIEALRSSRSVTKFPLLEEMWTADSTSAGNAVKVLYQPCTKSRNEKAVHEWESDLSVHSVILPSASCLELLLILCWSTAALPPSLRRMNAFQVAFLKM